MLVVLQGLFLGAGLSSFALGVLLPSMSQDLGWSLATIVGANSAGSVAASLASAPLGGVVDRYGARWLLFAATLLSGLGILLCGLVQEPWQFYLVFGIVPGICRAGMMSAAPGPVLVRWFQRRRATAFSIVAVGPPLAGLAFPPITALLLAWTDWRSTWVWLGAATVLLSLVPLLLIRRDPADLGLLPDGERRPEGDHGSGARPGGHDEAGDWTFREAVRSWAFWAVASGTALVMVMPSALLLFLFSFFRGTGFSDAGAAGLLSAAYSVQIVARLGLWGPLVARLGSVRWAAPLWGALMMASTLFFMLVQNDLLAYASIVVFGVAMGGSMVIHLQIWPEYFGRRAVGAITGLGALIWGVPSAGGPLIAATVLDRTGDYHLVFAIVSALVGVGVLLLLVTGRPVRPTRLPI